MVDAKAATDLAPGWTNVRDLREITSESGVINLPIPDFPSSGTPTTVTTSLTIDPFVEFVEFVEVNAHFFHVNFRDLTVELVSPSGTVSTLSTTALRFGSLTYKFRFGSGPALGRGRGRRVDACGLKTLVEEIRELSGRGVSPFTVMASFPAILISTMSPREEAHLKLTGRHRPTRGRQPSPPTTYATFAKMLRIRAMTTGLWRRA